MTNINNKKLTGVLKIAEALYLNDAYLKEWTAKVISVNDGGNGHSFIVMDKTAFYPKGGGQPHDEGIIIKEDIKEEIKNGIKDCVKTIKEYKVIFTVKLSGEISNEIDNNGNEPLKPGDVVQCRLNWERRYKLMRMHTACHVFAGVLHKETGAMITGNQLETDQSRIDFSVEQYNPEKLIEYVNKANAILNEEHNNKIYYLDKNADVDKFLRLAKGLPPNITNIRIVEIVGFDAQPDGGTHVHNTKEVGRIVFQKSENKGKNNRRVYFSLE